MTFSRRYFEFVNIILGSKTIKIQLSFPFLPLSYHASIRTTSLPFENSDRQGIHTVKVTLLTVPAKSSARHIIFPTSAWFSFHTRNLKGNQFFFFYVRSDYKTDVLTFSFYSFESFRKIPLNIQVHTMKFQIKFARYRVPSFPNHIMYQESFRYRGIRTKNNQ